MNIAILSYSSERYKSNKLIIDAGKKRNHNVFVLNPKHLVLYLSDKEFCSRIYSTANGVLERLPKIDCVIPRLSDVSSAHIIDFFTNNLGVYSTINSDSIRVCNKKWLTLMKANAYDYGIKVPKTIYCSDFKSENLDSYIQSLGMPLILKLDKGSQGVGVMLFSEKQALKTTAETFSKQGTPFILQEMIATKGKQHDFRTIVIGNECVATMKKTVNGRNEFRSNLARKGTSEPYELREKERLFCLKVAQSIGGDGGGTFGIDWMVNQDGEPVLIEVNSNYGTKIIDVVGHNFFEDLFFHIEIVVEDLKKLRKQKDSEKKENNILYEEIENLKNDLIKNQNLISEILENEKMKNIFSSLKGKKLGYIDSEKKEKEKKIMKPKDIIEMMIDMLEIEK
jgi:ribosomal protein S6--L-glutamate ligase